MKDNDDVSAEEREAAERLASAVDRFQRGEPPLGAGIAEDIADGSDEELILLAKQLHAGAHEQQLSPERRDAILTSAMPRPKRRWIAPLSLAIAAGLALVIVSPSLLKTSDRAVDNQTATVDRPVASAAAKPVATGHPIRRRGAARQRIDTLYQNKLRHARHQLLALADTTPGRPR